MELVSKKINRSFMQKLENDISDLKVEYESYFMGIVKIEPIAKKRTLERLIRHTLAGNIMNTAQRFQFKQLCARFSTYNQYWTRIQRKIEDGTYERDKFKLALKEKAAPIVRARGTDDNPKEHKYHDLYSDLMDAKASCNESGKKLSYQTFHKALSKQAEQLKTKYNCKKVEFKIEVVDGKTKIKAIPKR